MKPTFDIARYVFSFRVSAPQGVLMATRLGKRAPKESPEGVRRALDRVRHASAKVHAEWKLRANARKPAPLRNTMAQFAGAWNALHARLFAWTKLSSEEHTESVEAQELLGAVFPSGLGFLVGDPGEQWLKSEHRVEALTSDVHKEALTRLAGAPFVAAVRTAHLNAGAALGMVGEVAQKTANTDLRPLLQELVQAIREYALQVIAAADLSKPAEVARVTHLLEPIDMHRARVEARADDEDADGEEEHRDEPAPTPDATVRDAKPANDAPGTPARDRRVA